MVDRCFFRKVLEVISNTEEEVVVFGGVDLLKYEFIHPEPIKGTTEFQRLTQSVGQLKSRFGVVYKEPIGSTQCDSLLVLRKCDRNTRVATRNDEVSVLELTCKVRCVQTDCANRQR